MEPGRIEKDIFPGLMMPPFHYACFTRFMGFSEDRSYTVHRAFQVMLGLSGTLHFEIEGERREIAHRAGSVFVLSPGIRHRWRAEPGGFCENFMFFCDGFSDSDSDLGHIFNVKSPEIIWLFDLAPEEYGFYLAQFRELIAGHDCCNGNIIHGLLHAFCGLICRRANRLYAPVEQGGAHPALNRALALINRDYLGRITLAQLSRQCGLGSSRLSELFRDAFGMSPIQYVHDLKLRKACQLLSHSDMNITQIAEYLGFASVHYFSRFFKSHTGVAPSDYSGLES